VTRNRITNFTLEVPEDLLANPRNARRHPGAQRDVIRGSLDELGWVAPVIVNDLTGYVVDGHARIEEAISEGTPVIPVIHVELDAAEERLALAVLDPTGDLAIYDQTALDDLIASVLTESTALTDLLASLSGEEVDSKPIHIPPRTDKRTLTLTYDADTFTEVAGGLSLCPGSDASDKVLRLVRDAIG
jgi:hypothetical protein